MCILTRLINRMSQTASAAKKTSRTSSKRGWSWLRSAASRKASLPDYLTTEPQLSSILDPFNLPLDVTDWGVHATLTFRGSPFNYEIRGAPSPSWSLTKPASLSLRYIRSRSWRRRFVENVKKKNKSSQRSQSGNGFNRNSPLDWSRPTAGQATLTMSRPDATRGSSGSPHLRVVK